MHAASVRAPRRGAPLRPCGAAPRRSSTTRRSARRVPCAARRRGEEAYEEAEDEEEDEATAALREKLMQQYDAAQEDPEREPLDGWALRELMQDKWGASYEVRIVRRSDPLGVKRFYCQVRECEVVHPPRAPRRGPTAMRDQTARHACHAIDECVYARSKTLIMSFMMLFLVLAGLRVLRAVGVWLCWPLGARVR